MQTTEIIKPLSLIQRIEKQVNEKQLLTRKKQKENVVIEVDIIWPKWKMN